MHRAYRYLAIQQVPVDGGIISAYSAASLWLISLEELSRRATPVAASLTNNAVVIGGGGQATSTISASTTRLMLCLPRPGAPRHFDAIASGDLPIIPNTLADRDSKLQFGATGIVQVAKGTFIRLGIA